MIAPTPFLFASDLDGTLLPNTGKQPEPGCLERTQALIRWLLTADCPVCFVSGRHLSLARKGQRTFRLPQPTWWVCNVGTEIYDSRGMRDEAWFEYLGPVFDHAAMRAALVKIRRLTQQEATKQGPHKFSLYYPQPASSALRADIMDRLSELASDLRLVHSVEESTGGALLDVLPARAGKAPAIQYLVERHGLRPERVFFAGDSGNDLDALVSGVRGMLVGNAPEPVRAQAVGLGEQTEGAHLYLAEAFYGDGIIEGLLFYGFLREQAKA